MDAGFFRGASSEQDSRFSDKEKKLLKTMKFEPQLEQKIDMNRVNLDVIKPWITIKVNEMLGMEDDVVIEYILSQLETKELNPKLLQINVTGFLNARRAREFVGELWNLFIEANEAEDGIPKSLVDKKLEEMKINDSVKRENQREEDDWTKRYKNLSNGRYTGPTKEKEVRDDRISKRSLSPRDSPPRRNPSPRKSPVRRNNSPPVRGGRNRSPPRRDRDRRDVRRRDDRRREVNEKERDEESKRREIERMKRHEERDREEKRKETEKRRHSKSRSRSPIKRRSSTSPARRRSRSPGSPVRRKSRSPRRSPKRSPPRRRFTEAEPRRKRRCSSVSDDSTRKNKERRVSESEDSEMEEKKRKKHKKEKKSKKHKKDKKKKHRKRSPSPSGSESQSD